MKLRRLIYRSKADDGLSRADIRFLAERSKQANNARQISGALILYKGHFFQVLEGPADNMVPLVDVIRQDTRHSDFTVLLDEMTEKRYFQSWGMNFIDEPQTDLRLCLDEFLSNSPPSAGMLKGFIYIINGLMPEPDMPTRKPS